MLKARTITRKNQCNKEESCEVEEECAIAEWTGVESDSPGKWRCFIS